MHANCSQYNGKLSKDHRKQGSRFNHPKILCSPSGDGDGKSALRSGLRQTTHTLKCHLTNWSSDLAKKKRKEKQ